VVTSWHQEDRHEKNDLSDGFWSAMGELEDVVEAEDGSEPNWEKSSPVLVAARSLGLENDPQFWQEVATNTYLHAAVTALGQHLERVPDVEVTSTRSPVHVETTERPPQARRSGAKNLSDPIYQNAFISEARSSLGQPSAADAHNLIGARVTLVFIAKPPVTGILTRVVNHPTSAPTYLVLDDREEIRYSLNSIQEIKSS
jgi:hypothetical protein